MPLFEKISANATNSIYNFQIPQPAGLTGSTSTVTTLAKTMIEPMGFITSGPEAGVEASPEVPAGAEAGPEAGPESWLLGYLVEIGSEQMVEAGPGSLVEVTAESFAEVGPGNMVETTGGTMVELQPGSQVELISQNVEVVSGQLIEATPGAEVSVLPFTTFESAPGAFQVSVVPGTEVSVEGGFLVAATGSSVELVSGSNAEQICGSIVEVGPEQMVELMPGASVELPSGPSLEAGLGIEVPANYVQVEASPETFITVALGSEVEVQPIGGAEFTIEMMPGSEAEAETWGAVEVLPGTLEQVNGEFLLEVIGGSPFPVQGESNIETDAGFTYQATDGNEANANPGNEVVLWSGTMVSAKAWWMKLTQQPVPANTQIAYSAGVTSADQGFSRSIESSGLDGISVKLSAAFSSSTGQTHNIQLTSQTAGTVSHNEPQSHDVWQLVVAFSTDSGASIVDRIAPSQVPFLLT